MRGKRIAIIFDDPRAESGRALDDDDCGDMVAAVKGATEAIESRGAEVVPVVILKGSFDFVPRLLEAKPDLVLNFSDSFFGDSQFEPTLAGILESLGIPFTGTGSRGLSLALDKGVAKAILRGHGLPTPEGRTVLPGDPADDLPLPAMVKPAAEDGSVGITADSVVRTREALADRVRHIQKKYEQAALVEEYIEGREINVALWGNGSSVKPLPASEIDFSEFPEDLPPIVTLNAKWSEESAEYKGTRPVCPAKLSPTLEEKLNRIGSEAFRIFELRDFGRVDFRVRREDPYVIDVNPNPDISPDAGFPRATAAVGYDYAATIEEIGRLALERFARA